ncbi:MAG: DUF1993 domain-containing protein [Alphaproteobacteria bacterium]|nr:DUF1993 domain-containing protein [Alphaproteobacteria bacterium]MBL6938054.1 DUF1993 domain-containing protein [Alphaproteobacteria bacterium]MBL7099121.1 DUF1993 domain-containing protein [Alphaproteobacteria bacterium]
MTYSIYDASVPVMTRALTNLSKILDKAVAQAKAEDKPLSSLTEAKLAEDMRPFTFQIQSASDAAKGCAARLAGIEAPSMPDTETTFPELHARLQKTIDFLNTVKPEQLKGAEDREIVLKFPNGEFRFNGKDFLAGFSLPNFFFHVTTAYAILRHKGINIGKMDFLGGI